MTWTQFWDMNSGGGRKEPFEHCYIEAPEDEAVAVFYSRFGHNPNRVTCTCCGPDYSVSDYETLEQASGYHRGCDHDRETGQYVERPATDPYARPYLTVEEYLTRPEIEVIRADEITDDERTADVPEQGYVWQD
jgi:hypothetical protein